MLLQSSAGGRGKGEGKEKGRGKGKTKPGGKGGKEGTRKEWKKESCHSWGRGRDGPCAQKEVTDQECLCEVKRMHICEYCGSADHKSKDCDKKPANAGF